MSTEVIAPKARNTALDGLRGIAILLVVLSHLWVLSSVLETDGVVRILFSSGNYAVAFFFVIGGFLATRAMLRQVDEERFHPGVTFTRRWIRISAQVYPLVIAVLALTSVDQNMETYSTTDTRESAFRIVTYTWNDYIRTNSVLARPDLGHLWYVCTDLWVVGMILIAVWILGRRRPLLLAALLTGAALSYAYRHHVYVTAGEAHALIRVSTRADGLLWGAAAAVAQPWLTRWRGHAQTAGLVAALTLPLFAWGVNGTRFFSPTGVLLNVALAVLVLAVTMETPHRGLRPVLTWRPLVVLGRYSFAAYVWHYPIFWYVSRNYLDWAEETKVVVALAVTVVVSLLAQRLIEVPVQRWLASSSWSALDRGIPHYLADRARTRIADWRAPRRSRADREAADAESPEHDVRRD